MNFLVTGAHVEWVLKSAGRFYNKGILSME